MIKNNQESQFSERNTLYGETLSLTELAACRAPSLEGGHNAAI